METRVEKYKQHRNSLMKEGTENLETPSENLKHHSTVNTTSTLPLNEVIKQIDQEEDKNYQLHKKEKKKKVIIQIIIASSIALVAIAAVIVLGILAFK